MSVTVTIHPEIMRVVVDGDVAIFRDFPPSHNAKAPAAGVANDDDDAPEGFLDGLNGDETGVDLHPPLYYIAFSDGTLIAGDGRGHLRIEAEGAGKFQIVQRGAVIDWNIEWVVIAPQEHGNTAQDTRYDNAVAEAEKSFNLGDRVDYAPGVGPL